MADLSRRFDHIEKDVVELILADILCLRYPPKIPTHTEYTLESDDGTVLTNSMVYPSLEASQTILNSTMKDHDIPRNYMANLT